jgi:DNA-binding ferritin-like protein
MKELASVLLHSRTQAHVFHLRVKGPGSFAAHLALQEYYEGIIPILDGLVEAYQGKNGLIFFDNVDDIDNGATIQNIVKYFDKIISIVDKLRKDKSLQDSFFQNEIDNIVGLLYSTKYKLENLA